MMICHSNNDFFAETSPTCEYPHKGWLGSYIQGGFQNPDK